MKNAVWEPEYIQAVEKIKSNLSSSFVSIAIKPNLTTASHVWPVHSLTSLTEASVRIPVCCMSLGNEL